MCGFGLPAFFRSNHSSNSVQNEDTQKRSIASEVVHKTAALVCAAVALVFAGYVVAAAYTVVTAPTVAAAGVYAGWGLCGAAATKATAQAAAEVV